MTSPERGELLRAPLFHTPRNPFLEDRALVCHEDGGLLIRNGRVAACGDFETLRSANPEASTTDLRGGFLLPGLIDTHLHFPQVRVIGSLGLGLLEWLEQFALPEALDLLRAIRRSGETAAEPPAPWTAAPAALLATPPAAGAQSGT